MKNRIIVLSFLFVILLSSFISVAQINKGFEYSLKGWLIKGTKENISLDSINMHDGKYCARIGKNASIIQKIIVSPLSVLQFNFYIKCSNEKTKANSLLRFYDMHDRELMEYKGGKISPQKYEQTGNYTEAPPFTKYAFIGIERDSTEGNVYVDDLEIELNIGVASIRHKPICDLDQYMKPFWKGDTVYNETVLLYSENEKAANGRLLFNPSKIISIKSFDLKTQYKIGEDYSIENNIITRRANSKIPFRADTSFDTKNNLAWYNLQSQWVVVTYTHTEKWESPVPVYKGNLLPNTIAKLKSKSPLKIVAYGMSITRGLNVSSYDSVPPYMPTYVELFARELRKKYNYKNIQLYNAGLPGATVDWGADHADKYINPLKPDLVIIDFGMNDFWRLSPEEFKGYIKTIIDKIKTGNSKTEFLLISNMDFDPDYILDSDKNKSFYVTNMQGYKKVLKEFETNGIANLDMTTLSDIIHQKKKAKDCIVNPLHPNDYLARWYAQCMSAILMK